MNSLAQRAGRWPRFRKEKLGEVFVYYLFQVSKPILDWRKDLVFGPEGVASKISKKILANLKKCRFTQPCALKCFRDPDQTGIPFLICCSQALRLCAQQVHRTNKKVIANQLRGRYSQTIAIRKTIKTSFCLLSFTYSAIASSYAVFRSYARELGFSAWVYRDRRYELPHHHLMVRKT